MEDARAADFSEALVKLGRAEFDREYWHARTPAERLEALGYLRRVHYEKLGIAMEGPMEKMVVVKSLRDRP
jgi:hypothetical protein